MMRDAMREGCDGYSPAHITAFFAIHIGRTAYETGSTGAGVCLEDGVTTSLVMEPSDRMELTLLSNGSRVASLTCESLFQSLTEEQEPVSVTASQESIYPMNYGYGMSAASALSLGFALNKVMGLCLTRNQVGARAHVAEVECMTGLGDASAELVGGFEIRDKPGAPGVGRATRLEMGEGVAVLSSPVKPFPTKSMITERQYVEKINLKGRKALASFASRPDLRNLMVLSRRFWNSIGLIDDEMLGIMRRYEKAGVTSPSAKKGIVFGLVSLDDIARVMGAITGLAPSRLDRKLPIILNDPSSGKPLIASNVSKGGAS